MEQEDGKSQANLYCEILSQKIKILKHPKHVHHQGKVREIECGSVKSIKYIVCM